MAKRDSFVEYVLELLEKLGPVQERRMFGGWGLYSGGRMFGLIAEGQLYLKTDELTRPEFHAQGGRPFIYESATRSVEMSYWTPPPDAADDAYALLPWARRAVEAADRAARKKDTAKKKAPVAKKAAAKKAAPKRRVANAPPAKKRAGARKVAKLKRS
ncbi:TfoX/Sxy family protein [Myxococcus stipitatus]|uniref:TfoX/Sxy family protein n=1 Tax=Myxococcus stipitatus TaxID=83455 RepID=UPI001F2F17C5|nr:TfoX/Sxy family protein [Myxococcus stipitatus]MCE9669667.1 TfoX/Sxy family protein [Myxococcus stipitatus]